MFHKPEGKSRQAGFVSLTLAGAVALASIATLFGQGVTNKVLDLLDGGAWVLNAGAGGSDTVSHINIAQGKVDALYDLAGQSPITSIKTINGAVVALHADGTVTVLRRDLGPAPLPTPDLSTEIALLSGRDVVYAVKTQAGEGRPLASAINGLAPLGDWVDLGGTVSSAVVDADDRLLTAIPATGEVSTVDHTDLESEDAFAPGSSVRLVRAATSSVLVDFTAGSLRTLSGQSFTVELPALPKVSRGPAPVVEASATDGVLAIVSGGELVAVDLVKRTAIRVDLQGAEPRLDKNLSAEGDAPSLAVSGKSAYVITKSGDAVVVDLEQHTVTKEISRDYAFTDVSPGGNGAVLNDSLGDKAVAIDSEGEARDVVKYTPTTVEQAKEDRKKAEQDTPEPVAAPSAGGNEGGSGSDPAPGKNPGGGSGAGTGAGPGSGPGGQPTPTPSNTPPKPKPPATPEVFLPAGVNGDVTVTFAPGKGGGPVLGYEVTLDVTHVTGGTELLTASLAKGTLQTQFLGLACNDQVRAKVAAIGEAGLSSESGWSPPAGPCSAPDPVTGLAATQVTSNEVRLDWDAPNASGKDAITAYILEVRIAGGGGTVVGPVQIQAPATSKSFANLPTNTNYTFAIRAVGKGPDSVSTEMPVDWNLVRHQIATYEAGYGSNVQPSGTATRWEMCVNNPALPSTAPSGVADQSFTVANGVRTITSALVQIDGFGSNYTAHADVLRGGSVIGSSSQIPNGDTAFGFGDPGIPVTPGEVLTLRITWSASAGKVSSVYFYAQGVYGGGSLSITNSCRWSTQPIGLFFPSRPSAGDLKAQIIGFD